MVRNIRARVHDQKQKNKEDQIYVVQLRCCLYPHKKTKDFFIILN